MMKLAMVNGERRDPEKGLLGSCIGCGNPVIPKCGPIKIWHWAHKSDCECDRWWENETKWHRAWKSHFPKENQEVRHKDEVTGEWHIADVKTTREYILEFQHSFLSPLERQSRNKFYGEKLVWIVDGLKRQRDKSQFDLFLKNAVPLNQDSPILKLHPFLNECRILEEWSECGVPVFFDFGPEWPLWGLLPKSSKGHYYVFEYSRKNFIALHSESLNGYTFSDLINHLLKIIIAYEFPELIEAAKRGHDHERQQAPFQRATVRLPRVNISDLRWLERQISQPQRQPNRYRRFKRL